MKGIFALLPALLLAGCNDGDVNYDSPSPPPPPPEAPSDVQAGLDGDTATVTWTSSPDAESHNLYWSTDLDQSIESYAAYANAGMMLDAEPPVEIEFPGQTESVFFMVTAVVDGEEIGPARGAAFFAFRASPSDPSVIVDHVNGLEWRRCSVGQTWNAGVCDGDATVFTDTEAYNTYGVDPPSDGWRPPTRSEVRASVGCGAPVGHNSNSDCYEHRHTLFAGHSTDPPLYFIYDDEGIMPPGYPPYICASGVVTGGHACGDLGALAIVRVTLVRPLGE